MGCMYTPRFSQEKASEREEEEGGWYTPAVAEVVPVGSETSWAPLPELPELPDPEVESRQNQPPASQTADGKTNNRLCRFSKW